MFASNFSLMKRNILPLQATFQCIQRDCSAKTAGCTTKSNLKSHILFSFFLPQSVLQVLYQAVNYQMEPVVTESGQEADETDSVKVCVC